MIRFFARWRAKQNYIWAQELEAGKNELNAKAALQRAATITAEADALEANITKRDEMEEKGFWACENGHEKSDSATGVDTGGAEIVVAHSCLDCGSPAKFISRETMSGQDKYQSDKERKAATDMLATKRKDIEDANKAAQYFSKMAAQSQEFAEKLRKL